MSKSTTLALTFAVASSVVFAACSSQGTTSQIPQTQTQTATSATTKTVSFDTHYISPGGDEKISFQIGVDANGLITNATTTVGSENPTGIMRQTAFANSLPAIIKGKKLSDLGPIDRVGGSSLTTKAFNSALAQLKSQLNSAIAVAPSSTESVSPTQKSGVYIVQVGDSLWSIAQKQYGSGDAWKRLYEANKKIIGINPGKLLSGTTIILP